MKTEELGDNVTPSCLRTNIAFIKIQETSYNNLIVSIKKANIASASHKNVTREFQHSFWICLL